MQPFAETFTVSAPIGGADSVFITGIDLYFATKSTTNSIELQIRTTENGAPSIYTLPYASKVLSPSVINVSATGVVGTSFIFDTPVIVPTNQLLAFVINPLGGTTDYSLWSAINGSTDVSTGSKINVNNQLGTMYLATNDITAAPMSNQFLKYTLRIADFSASGNTGQAAYHNSNTDFILVQNQNVPFASGEKVLISNNVLNLAALTISSSNVFNIGEVLYQPNTAANVSSATAHGVVYFANTTNILLQNTVGTFVVTTTVGSANSSKLVGPTNVYQGIQTTANSASVSVPNCNTSLTTDFTVGNYLYIASSSQSDLQILSVIAVNPATRTITLGGNVRFTDTNAFCGRVKSDANLYGYFSTTSKTLGTSIITLDSVNVNAQSNFANSSDQYLLGTSSRAVAKVVATYNMYYDSITSQFTSITDKKAPTNWSFRGTSNTALGKAFDVAPTIIAPNAPYEFIDEQRILMSRSNEFAYPSSAGVGNSSLVVYANVTASNSSFSPYIDQLQNSVVLTHNIIKPTQYISGYYITIANANNKFNVGDTVWQSNSTVNTTAMVIGSNNYMLIVANVQSSNTLNIGQFNANGSSVITDVNTGAAAKVASVAVYNETQQNNIENSRYISQNVILAQNQDSEDLVTFVTAYRAPNTNLYAYGKFLSALDSDMFDNKSWSIMPETSSPALLSSLVDKNDLLELTYGLPQSSVVYTSGITTNTVLNTSAVINLPVGATTTKFAPGSFVYIVDNSYVIVSATINGAGSGYVNGDVIQISNAIASYVNATFNVVTNGSGGVISVVANNIGSYYSNTTITGNPTASVSGIGTGLTLNVSGTQYQLSTRFNVRQVAAVPNTSSLVLSSNVSLASGNVGLGSIPGIQSQYSAFKYDQNNNIIRYVTPTDGVFDSYKTFAIKIVMVADTSYVVPRMSDVRCLALQV